MIIIGVMGSGKHEWTDFAAPLGVWIGENHFDLLTGAGRGVMLSVSRAFCTVLKRQGKPIGIVPMQQKPHGGFCPLAGYPNPYIEIPVFTPLPRREPDMPIASLTRNHVNILTRDVIIALPGNAGTRDEIRLVALFCKPVICFGPPAQFADIVGKIETLVLLDDIKRFVQCMRPRRGDAGEQGGRV